MNAVSQRGGRMKGLLAAAATVGFVGSVFIASPAQADAFTGFYSSLSESEQAKDPDGTGGTLGVKKVFSQGGSVPYNWATFYDNGEMLQVYDAVADGHSTRVQVYVYNSDGTSVADADTYYVGTAENGKSINLGTPDGSGDIPEGRRVGVRVCINEVFHCSDWRYYKA